MATISRQKKDKQKYQYKRENSILGSCIDEYKLSEEEFCKLYSFYVTYSMCGSQSAKKRTFIDYGWPDNAISKTELGEKLKSVLKLSYNKKFVFTDKDNLAEQFHLLELDDGELINLDQERAVISKTSENNNYLKLFYRIRYGLAHGKFRLLFSSSGERMVIIQDDNTNNVTARIVIKLSTLLLYIDVIDVNGSI